jgi:hypothetical protein
MTTNKTILPIALVCALVVCMAGCSSFGKVEQGRVIVCDQQNRVVTVIRDSSPAAGRPKFDMLPPIMVKLPSDPNEVGPYPEAGARLLFDTQNNQVVFFDVRSGTIKTITYTPTMVIANVARDDPRASGIQFPVIDRQNKTITIYSSADKKLVTFTVPDEYFALPDDTWKAGDDVRYYYKQPGQTIRFMNVTKTNTIEE